jgi:alkylhydroperoxidase/carboxymuconolactone decarboxylase family protein YurZ
MAQATLPPWIQTLRQRDPEFADSYVAQRERVLRDGAIPAKYKHLMTMIVDALLAHPDGVATIANRARAAGADPGGRAGRVPVRRDPGARHGRQRVPIVVRTAP